MKLKKKPKIILTIIVIIIALCLVGFILVKLKDKEPEVKEVKIENSIKKYGYNLKENKPKKYKEMFSELKEILSAKEVDEEAYVKKIAEMFVFDFYSLEDKTAKTDVGGVEFVYKDVLNNFLENAENTYYKYLESNIYDNRKQELQVVDEITIESLDKDIFAYNNTSDEEAYKVKVKWTYTDEKYSSYQTEATLIFIHDDFKLSLVELK